MDYIVNADGTVTVGQTQNASDVLEALNTQLTNLQADLVYHQGMVDSDNTQISTIQAQIDSIQTAPAVVAVLKPIAPLAPANETTL